MSRRKQRVGHGWNKEVHMSVNACTAYENGRMPISKWTKGQLLQTFSKFFGEEKTESVTKFPAEVLRAVLLETKEWHHTSGMRNRVDFYGFARRHTKKHKDEEAAFARLMSELNEAQRKHKAELATREKPVKVSEIPLEQCEIYRGEWTEKARDFVHRGEINRFQCYGYVRGNNFFCLNKKGELTGQVKRITGRYFCLHEQATMEEVKQSKLQFKKADWY
jgi:hypothetical protein